MNKPHKQAELIKAWADGAEIEKQANTGEWFIDYRPNWYEDGYYRIKPEPKPDFIEHYYFRDAGALTGVSSTRVQYTFDGETGKLKSAEVI